MLLTLPFLCQTRWFSAMYINEPYQMLRQILKLLLSKKKNRLRVNRELSIFLWYCENWQS